MTKILTVSFAKTYFNSNTPKKTYVAARYFLLSKKKFGEMQEDFIQL